MSEKYRSGKEALNDLIGYGRLKKTTSRSNIIAAALVLHDGWEMDNVAWAIETDGGEKELRTTSHGMECHMTMGELMTKIRETKSSLKELKALKRMMEQKQ